MIEKYYNVFHEPIGVGVRTSSLGTARNLFEASVYAVSEADSTAEFVALLGQSPAAMILGSCSEEMQTEDIEKSIAELLNWTSQGNLLIVNDLSFLTNEVRCRLGISEVYEIDISSKCSTHEIGFTSTTPLVFNLRQTVFTVHGPVFGFRFADLSSSIIVAEACLNTSEVVPAVAVLSQVGNGYCMVMGFDIISAAVEQTFVRRALYNAVQFYATASVALRTNAYHIPDAFSPNLYPMSTDSSLFIEIGRFAHLFCDAGFNVYHTNLLSADYSGGFYASLFLTGPMSSLVRLFGCRVNVAYRGWPCLEFSAKPAMPDFASGVFTSMVLDCSPKLCWPSGWAPPQVGYYHLAPNIEAVSDMGTTQWVPKSVENVLEARSARDSFGYDGTGIDVAVIDTGFSRNINYYPTPHAYHPFYEQYYASLLVNRYHAYPTGGHHPDSDPDGHGTAIVSNLLAIAPGINLHMIDWEDLVEAFDTVLTIQPDVVSCSWLITSGPPSGPSELQARIRQAALNGIIVAFAAGNEGWGPAWPGSEPCVVSVGGVYADQNGNLQAASYASSGSVSAFGGRLVPDFCGIVGQGTGGLPKERGILIEMPTEFMSDIDSDFSGTGPRGDETLSQDGWCVMSGTSSSTPQIAGLAALVKQVEPSITESRFKHLVMSTCTDVYSGHSADGDYAKDGFDRATGAGLINVYRTLETLLLYNSINKYAGRTMPTGKTVNFYPISVHGPGYHIDTVGTNEYPFTFLGYLASRSQPTMVNQNGFMVFGWFRQYDTLPESLWPGRRFLNLYVLSADGLRILKTVTILTYSDGTGWKFVSTTVILSQDMWGMVRVAFGRVDNWLTDWKLTAEWGSVEIHSFDTWVAQTVPIGMYVNEYPLPPSELGFWTGHHIDTNQGGQYGYTFCARPLDYAPFFGIGEIDIAISGWFRQYDTFSDPVNRRYLDAYVINPDTMQIVKSQRILSYYDGTDWVYRHVHFKMPWAWYWHYYYVEIGRDDSWSQEWNLVAEWCTLQITVGIPY
jgi:hypothetical protein